MKYTKKQLMPIFKMLTAKCKLFPVGGWRRGKPLMKDIDFITKSTLSRISKRLSRIKYIKDLTPYQLIKEERRKLSFHVHYKNIKVQIDIFRVLPEERPFALLQYTGNKMFNIAMRGHAKKLGYKLNQYGLYKHGKPVKVKNEKDIFRIINFPYRSPKHRDIGEPTHKKVENIK